MEFRLTYEGPLLAESHRDGSIKRARAQHKHEIRQKLHPQLKRWWSTSPYLRPHDVVIRPGSVIFGRPSPDHTIEALSKRFDRCGYQFVPLVTRDLELSCSVDILLLKQGQHGDVFTVEGDLDNRFKTLFDALSIPRNASQLGQYATPGGHEKPFFCLVEDDSLITKASVETDILLDPVNDPPDKNDVRAVISVKIRPGRVNHLNIGFA